MKMMTLNGSGASHHCHLQRHVTACKNHAATVVCILLLLRHNIFLTYVCHMFTICLSRDRMFTICLPYIYRMLNECLPYFYHMGTLTHFYNTSYVHHIMFPHAYCMFTVCLLTICSGQSRDHTL